MMHDTFSDYEISPYFINSSKFGLPQARERFLVVGRRRDVTGAFSFPDRIVKSQVTVGDALKGLPEPPKDYSVHPRVANHQNAKVSDINILRFSHVPQGGGWKDIPESMRLPCHQRVDTEKGGWPDIRGRYGHPLQDRPLTPREAARIQGFPDDYIFEGNRGDVRSQIGNAVPPPVAYGVGSYILKALLVADGLIKETQPHAILCDDVEEYKVRLRNSKQAGGAASSHKKKRAS
jgi:DNA (cytosine-5)-methyltransferase 1